MGTAQCHYLEACCSHKNATWCRVDDRAQPVHDTDCSEGSSSVQKPRGTCLLPALKSSPVKSPTTAQVRYQVLPDLHALLLLLLHLQPDILVLQCAVCQLHHARHRELLISVVFTAVTFRRICNNMARVYTKVQVANVPG